MADIETIERFLELILVPGAVAELRVPKERGGVTSGYFDQLAPLVEAAKNLSGSEPGVFVTLNPVKPALLARSKNRMKDWAKHTTQDADVVCRRYFLVDIDAVRPAGISATDVEHGAALSRAEEVADFLVHIGCPPESLLLADSGNGGHILVRLDLPSTKEAEGLLRSCLDALHLRFSDESVVIDPTTANAARLVKVCGTLAAKGDSTTERPHRISRLLKLPAEVVPAPLEVMQRLGTMAPTKHPPGRKGPEGKGFDLEKWIQDHGLVVKQKKAWNGATLWSLAACPWNPEHNRGEAHIEQFSNGAISAGCPHSSCHGKGWRELRAMFDGGCAYDGGGAAAEQEGSDAGPAATADRPVVAVTGRFMRDIVADSWKAVLGANEPPTVFAFGRTLADIVPDPQAGLSIRVMDKVILKGRLDQVADFTKPGKKGGSSPARPPDDVVEDMLKSATFPVPLLEGMIGTPVFGGDGKLCAAEGYQPETRCFLRLPAGLRIPEVSLHPSPEEVARAKSIIMDELLADFPFETDADRAHAFALLLLPFARQLIRGATPLHLVEAPAEGTGKGLLVLVLAIPAAPLGAAVMPQVHDDDEMRKQITTKLIQGPQFILIDNIRGHFDPASLAAAITAPVWTDRILGKSLDVNVPVRCVWVATGNNPRLGIEMARRTVSIRLDAKVERPSERGGFKHQLPGWAQENRGQLIWAALTLIQAGVAAGLPRGKKTIGSFEDWSAVMGGILDVVGVKGFLDNRERVFDAAEDDLAEWFAFCCVWWEEYGSVGVESRTLFDLCRHRKLLTEIWSNREEHKARTAFGVALSDMRSRTLGEYRICFAGSDKHTKVRKYALKRISAGGAGAGEAPKRDFSDVSQDNAWKAGKGEGPGGAGHPLQPPAGPADADGRGNRRVSL